MSDRYRYAPNLCLEPLHPEISVVMLMRLPLIQIMGKHTLPSSCPDPQAPDCCRPKAAQEETDENMTEGEAERRAVEELEGFVPTLYDWPALTHGSSSMQRRALLPSATTECEMGSVRNVAAEVPENRWS